MQYRVEFELRVPGNVTVEASSEEEALESVDDIDVTTLFNEHCGNFRDIVTVDVKEVRYGG